MTAVADEIVTTPVVRPLMLFIVEAVTVPVSEIATFSLPKPETVPAELAS